MGTFRRFFRDAETFVVADSAFFETEVVFCTELLILFEFADSG